MSLNNNLGSEFSKGTYWPIFNRGPNPKFILDESGKILSMNKKGKKLLQDEGVESLSALFKNSQTAKKAIKDVLCSKQMEHEINIGEKQGKNIWLTLLCAKIRIKDKNYITVTARNISKLKKLQTLISRKNEEIKKRTLEMSAQHMISKAIAKSTDIDRLLDNVIKVLKDTLKYEFCFIAIKKGNKLNIHSNFRVDQIKNLERKILSGEGITGAVMKKGKFKIVGDTSKDPNIIPAVRKVRSELAVPLIIKKEVVGTIDVGSTKLSHYTQFDVRILKDFANQVSLALENIRLGDESRKRIYRLNTIYELSRSISSTFNQKKIFIEVAKAVSNMQNVRLCSIVLIDYNSGDLIPAVTFENGKRIERKTTINIEDSVCGMSIKDQQPIMILDAKSNKKLQCSNFMNEKNINSYLSVPLLLDKKPIGAVCVYSDHHREFTKGQIKFIKGLCHNISIAIKNARMFNRLKDFNEVLQEETYIATRELREKNEALGKLMKDSLSEKNKVEAIIDSMSEGIIVTYFDSSIMSFNQATEALLEFDSETFGPKKTTNYLTDIGIIELLEQAKEVSQPVFIKEFRIEEPVDKYVKAIITMLKDDDNNNIGMVTILSDITKIKEIDKMKSEFVSTVSHELRTPLTSIRGYSSLLLNKKLGQINTQQKQALEILTEESDRLTNLINDVLDLSKMESGRMKMNIDSHNISQLIEKTIKDLEFSAREKGISIHTNISKNIIVRCDKDRVKQVMINLINNAIKFTDVDGKVEVLAEKTKEFAKITVKDNGIGISKTELPKLFNKFYQVESHMTRKEGGTGLGLPIAKQIIWMHGGLLNVKSELGEGSDFFVYLPLKERTSREKIKKCWEELNCSEVTCPIYGSQERRCWLTPETKPCHKVLKTKSDKVNICTTCPVYKDSFDEP